MSTPTLRPEEIIVNSLSDHGWTCEYHEPDPGCTECDDLFTRTATEILRALRDAGWRVILGEGTE